MPWTDVTHKPLPRRAIRINSAEMVRLVCMVTPLYQNNWYTFRYDGVEFKTQKTHTPVTGDWIVEGENGADNEYFSAKEFAERFDEVRS